LGGSYFDIEVVDEMWRGDWDVRYWRQPLSVTSGEFADAGFLIERVVEPRPSTDLSARFPDDYAKLCERPAFIMFRLVRP
jgi:hypothetical protein